MKIFGLAVLLLLTGCVTTSVSVTSSEKKQIQGLKGIYEYRQESYRGTTIWTREDPNRMYEKHPDAWKRKVKPENRSSRSVTRILKEVYPSREGSRKALKTDQEIWDQVRLTWTWCVDNMRQDTVSLNKLRQENPDGASLHDHARVWETRGHLPTGTCGSVSHLFLQLAHAGGVPTDRIAMAQCTYPHASSPNGTASHAYVILWVNDGWYFLDPNARASHRTLPMNVKDLRSAGFPDRMGFEYTTPFNTVFYQPDPMGGRLPLVGN